ncbi:MAG TPA: hypothetical protein VGF87_01585 [Acidimicrobiales bacterium]
MPQFVPLGVVVVVVVGAVVVDVVVEGVVVVVVESVVVVVVGSVVVVVVGSVVVVVGSVESDATRALLCDPLSEATDRALEGTKAKTVTSVSPPKSADILHARGRLGTGPSV